VIFFIAESQAFKMNLEVIVAVILMCVSFNHVSDGVSLCPNRAWYCGNESLTSSWPCPMSNDVVSVLIKPCTWCDLKVSTSLHLM